MKKVLFILISISLVSLLIMSCNPSNSTVFEKGKNYQIITSHNGADGQIKVINIQGDWLYVVYKPMYSSSMKLHGNTYFNIHNIVGVKKID
jgi:hypothetical protein